MHLRAVIELSDEVRRQVGNVVTVLREVHPEVTWMDEGDRHLLLTFFGNVMHDEAARLASQLRQLLPPESELPSLLLTEVHVEGEEVLLSLGGDLDGTSDLARIVTRCAQGLNLYVDRRAFQKHLVIGRLPAGVDQVSVAASCLELSEWCSPPWDVNGVSLLRTQWSEGGEHPELEQFALVGG